MNKRRFGAVLGGVFVAAVLVVTIGPSIGAAVPAMRPHTLAVATSVDTVDIPDTWGTIAELRLSRLGAYVVRAKVVLRVLLSEKSVATTTAVSASRRPFST
jgi:hypothetical protein